MISNSSARFDFNAAIIGDRSKNIKLSASTEGRKSLKGSIVQFGSDDAFLFKSSPLLLGQIEEIVLLQEPNNAPIQKEESSLRTHQKRTSFDSSSPKLLRDHLLRKQLDQQQQHFQQSQTVIRNHNLERIKVKEHPYFSEEEKLYILQHVLDPMHQEQLLKMQEKNGLEQMKLTDFILESALTVGKDERVTEEIGLDIESSTGKINAVYGPDHSIPSPAVKLDGFHQRTISETNPNYEKLRREEIQAVMRDHSLQREEKQKKLVEIKARYCSLVPSSTPQDHPNLKQLGGVTSEIHKNTGASDEAASFPVNHAAKVSPQKITQTGKTNFQPIDLIIQQLKLNDASLTTLCLNGRHNISQEEWKVLFESLENNHHLELLSVQNCGLTSTSMVFLLLALVDNESIRTIDISKNIGCDDKVGRGLIKVLNQSNKTIRNICFEGTKISSSIKIDLETILRERDEFFQFKKLQESRKQKIEELLSFSASDNIVVQRQLLIIDEDSGDEKEYLDPSPTVKSSGSSSSSREKSISGSNSFSEFKRSSSSATFAKKDSLSRKSFTLQMVNTGGDMIGSNKKNSQEMRKLRGECENCGQKCYEKSLFKTIPLTVKDVVHQGQCLKCFPM